MSQGKTYYKHYFIYGLSFLVYGLTFTGIGPLIPYLAQNSHTTETGYSFVFFCRAFGMIVGTLMFKYLQQSKIFDYHQSIAISSFGIFLMCLSFTFSTAFLMQAASFLLNGFFFGVLETTINVSMIALSNEKNIQFLFLIINGIFGVGGLLGPIFVYFFQEKTFMAFGFIMLVMIPAYLMLQSSEKIKKSQERHNENTIKHVPNYGVTILCMFCFFYLGTICSIGGWSSSYAVMQGVKTKEGAVIYPTIFWGFITLARFFVIFLPGSSSDKLKVCIQVSLIIQSISFVIKCFGYINYALYFQSIFLGIAISPLYPMIYSISKEYGFQLKDDQVGNFVAAGPIGEGILTMLCGQLMDWIHIDMYFYLIIIFFIILFWCRAQLVSILSSKQDIDMQQDLVELNQK